jgi:hypothetical protein
MTQQQLSDLERAYQRAQRRGIVILARGIRRADGSRLYLTNSGSHADGTHIIVITGGRLTCDCPATGICVHRATVHARLVEEHAAATQATVKAGHAQAARRTDNRAFSIWK